MLQPEVYEIHETRYRCPACQKDLGKVELGLSERDKQHLSMPVEDPLPNGLVYDEHYERKGFLWRKQRWICRYVIKGTPVDCEDHSRRLFFALPSINGASGSYMGGQAEFKEKLADGEITLLDEEDFMKFCDSYPDLRKRLGVDFVWKTPELERIASRL